MGVYEDPGLEHAANPIHLGWHGERIPAGSCTKLAVHGDWHAKAHQSAMAHPGMVL